MEEKKRKIKMKNNSITFKDFLKNLDQKEYMQILYNKKYKWYQPATGDNTKWTSHDKEQPISFTNLGSSS